MQCRAQTWEFDYDLNTAQCVMTIVVSSVTPLTGPDAAHGGHEW